MKDFSLSYALLSIQSALLGIIDEAIRAVVIDINIKKNVFYIRFYYDGPISDDLYELCDCAITEASCYIGMGFETDGGIERLDYPQKIPSYGHYAYLRKEETNDQTNKLNKSILKNINQQAFIDKYFNDKKNINELLKNNSIIRKFINFEECIGYVINRETGEKIETTWGLVHYSTNKKYIIPAYHGDLKKFADGYVISYTLLSIQNALLGVVTPQLRAVFVNFNEKTQTIYIRIYYEKKNYEKILDLWENSVSEIYADIGTYYNFDIEIKRFDSPQELLDDNIRYAYLGKDQIKYVK